MAVSMLRENRLRKSSDFQRVQKAPSVRLRFKHFLVLASPADAGFRFGVVASKKVGNAVVRNRCKRLLRELFRSVSEFVAADVVVIAGGSLASCTLADLIQDWKQALSSTQAKLRSPRARLGA